MALCACSTICLFSRCAGELVSLLSPVSSQPLARTAHIIMELARRRWDSGGLQDDPRGLEKQSSRTSLRNTVIIHSSLYRTYKWKRCRKKKRQVDDEYLEQIIVYGLPVMKDPICRVNAKKHRKSQARRGKFQRISIWSHLPYMLCNKRESLSGSVKLIWDLKGLVANTELANGHLTLSTLLLEKIKAFHSQ